jgi:hypothetical protein
VLASPASVKNLLKKLQTIRVTRVLAVNVSALNRNRVRVLAHLGRNYHRDALQRFSTPKRTALLVCFLQDLHQDVLDHLLTSFQDLLTAIFRRTEQTKNKHHVAHGRALTRHVHTMRKAVQIILDPKVPDGLVRPAIFVTTPKPQLQAAYDDSGAIARPDDGQTLAFDLLEKRYSFLRKFLPDLLVALEFAGTQAAQPVTQAIAALKQMDTEGRRTLPPGAPMAFVSPEWRSAIERAEGAGGSGRVRGKHLWELCLASRMSQLLRSSDLSIPGSRQHKVWTAYRFGPLIYGVALILAFFSPPASLMLNGLLAIYFGFTGREAHGEVWNTQ